MHTPHIVKFLTTPIHTCYLCCLTTRTLTELLKFGYPCVSISKDLHVANSNKYFCVLFFLTSHNHSTQTNHTFLKHKFSLERKLWEAGSCLSCWPLYHSRLKRAWPCSFVKIICWMNRTYSLCGLTCSRLHSWELPPNSCPSLCLFMQFLFPPGDSSILGYLKVTSVIPMISNLTFPIYMVIPCLSPEIQASMSNFLMNFSNLRSHAHIIFIQNKLLNSYFVPQSFPFLWSSSTWWFWSELHGSSLFSLLPFHGPCGPFISKPL